MKFGSAIGVNPGRVTVSLVAGGQELEEVAESVVGLAGTSLTPVLVASWLVEDPVYGSKELLALVCWNCCLWDFRDTESIVSMSKVVVSQTTCYN